MMPTVNAVTATTSLSDVGVTEADDATVCNRGVSFSVTTNAVVDSFVELSPADAVGAVGIVAKSDAVRSGLDI